MHRHTLWLDPDLGSLAVSVAGIGSLGPGAL
jgi:hypothetical protein